MWFQGLSGDPSATRARRVWCGLRVVTPEPHRVCRKPGFREERPDELSPVVRGRAARTASDRDGDHPPRWAAVASISCMAATRPSGRSSARPEGGRRGPGRKVAAGFRTARPRRTAHPGPASPSPVGTGSRKRQRTRVVTRVVRNPPWPCGAPSVSPAVASDTPRGDGTGRPRRVRGGGSRSPGRAACRSAP